jgi:hypothetical protein
VPFKLIARLRGGRSSSRALSSRGSVVYGEVIVEWRSKKHFEELNAILDLLMIYGLLGVPRLELVGATLATVVLNAISIPMQLFFLKRLGLTPSLNPRSRYLKEGVKSWAFNTS